MLPNTLRKEVALFVARRSIRRYATRELCESNACVLIEVVELAHHIQGAATRMMMRAPRDAAYEHRERCEFTERKEAQR